MASVRERQYAEGLCWEGWYLDRRGKRRAFNTKIPVTGEKSKRAALELTLRAQANVQAGVNPFPANMKGQPVRPVFSAVWTEFLEEKRLTVRRGTVGLYEQTGKAWLGCMENLAVAEISAEVVRVFTQRRLKMAGKQGRIAPESVNRNLRDIKCFLRWASERGLLTKPPRIPLLKTEQAPLDGYRPEEMEKLLSAAREVVIVGVRFDIFVRVLLFSALRIGSALSLCWEDVDVRRRVLVLGGVRTKTGKQVTVPLSRPLIAALRDLPQPRRGRLFPWSATSGHLHEQWVVTVKRANVRYLKLHALRNTAARMMVEAGLKPHQLKEMLHAGLATTLKYYVGADREAITDAARRIGRSPYATTAQRKQIK